MLKNIRIKNFDTLLNKYYLTNVKYINSKIIIIFYRKIKYHLKNKQKRISHHKIKKNFSIYDIYFFITLSNKISKFLNNDLKLFI